MLRGSGTSAPSARSPRSAGSRKPVCSFRLQVNYDACVMMARELAKESGGLLLMDTAVEEDTAEERRWEG